ncbi:hypothetical protein GOBAR_AA35258 [Gossypium barbadense]|uniref:Uncharacterized protein n=1 Tax=Gossypium barbadense TaxID=3634 RepID=A0A2P5W2V4_GOSBA|nr:hypothetical protein GOBAR_AA35258 [Gossypium barbadense]
MFPMEGEWSLSEPRLPAKVVEESKKNDEGIPSLKFTSFIPSLFNGYSSAFHCVGYVLPSTVLRFSISFISVHNGKQMQIHSLARGSVRSLMGSNSLHRGLFWQILLPHWRLRLIYTRECSSSGASPPATIAEFTLNGAGGLDFYDVSLVDGYNLPMMVSPNGGTGGNCTSAFIGGAITILAAMRQLCHLF